MNTATIRLAVPGRHRQARTRPAPAAPGMLFSTCLLFCCLLLQRFGLPMGGKALSIVCPAGLGLAGLSAVRGTLGFRTVGGEAADRARPARVLTRCHGGRAIHIWGHD